MSKSLVGARILLASPNPVLSQTREALIRSFGFDVSATSGETDAFDMMEGVRFDLLLVIGHSLGSVGAARLAKAFRGHNPRGRVIEIAARPGLPPLNNPDAVVVGLDGPVALQSVLETQLRIAQAN